MGAESCLYLHGVQPNRRGELFGPSWGTFGRRRGVWSAFTEQMGSSKRRPETFRGGFAPAPRLPFRLLIEEKEAQEDPGDDRLQVGRIGAETCFGLHGVGLNGCRDCCVVSWDAGDGPQGLVRAGTKKAGYRLEMTLGWYPAGGIGYRG